MERRLYRSRKNKIIGGVAGGLGEYFDIDPVLVRVIFVVATLASGFGVLTYILLWIIVPKSRDESFVSAAGSEQSKTRATEETKVGSSSAEGGTTMTDANTGREHDRHKRQGGAVGGTVLIVLGILFLADSYLPIFSFSHTWPLILVAIGAALIYGSKAKSSKEGESHEG